jgi:hypothetical protein
MLLSGLREIRGWGHFSLLKHLFLCAERKFVATDLRLPSWDTTSPGQSVKAGYPKLLLHLSHIDPSGA